MAYVEKYVSSLAGGGGDGSSGSPWTLGECVANLAAGERGNIKADGSYSEPAAFTNSGTRTSPMALRGYTSTIGDGGRATIASLTSWNHLGGFVDMSDLIFTGNTSLELVKPGASGRYLNCKFDNAGSGSGIFPGATIMLVDCYLRSGSGRPITGGNCGLIRCHIEGGGTNALWTGTNYHGPIVGCTFIGDGTGPALVLTDTISYYLHAIIEGNSFYNFTNAIDISDLDQDNRSVHIVNNIFSTLSGDAVVGSATWNGGVTVHNNSFHAVTGSNLSGCDIQESTGEIELTGSPYTDAASGDLSLNNTAGAGADCRDAAVEAPSA